MKFKVMFILFLAMTSGVFAQVGKKPVATKKPVTAVKKVVTQPKKILPATANEGIFAEIETTKGKILLQLEYQKTPVTVANFIALAEGTNTFVTDAKLQGKPFYNGLKFHRVIQEFMIQGGDPLGNGSGNPGYKFKDEITGLKHDKPGTLSMANSRPGTNGSQFFITHKETSWLDGKHTVFGHVVTGMDVVNAIVQDDIINKVVIKRIGAAAKAFNAVKIFSDYYGNKGEDDKKQVVLDAEKRKIDEDKKQKQALLDVETKKLYTQKMGPVMAESAAKFAKLRSTATKSTTGLEYVIEKGTGTKPVEGTTIYVHYAGYFEDGSIFDSSYEEVNKKYEKFDQARADQNGYQPFPFQYGNKGGLIPGFIEGLNQMNIGDKSVLFIPANLAWGANGSGGVIPPNANVIFEVELLEKLPTK